MFMALPTTTRHRYLQPSFGCRLRWVFLKLLPWIFSFFSCFFCVIADWNLSSTELESENAIGAFLQTPAPVLDKNSGPMGARFLSSTGLGSGKLIGRAQSPPAPALDKNRSPMWFSQKIPPQQSEEGSKNYSWKNMRRILSPLLAVVGKPQTGSFVTGSSRQALATRSSSARQTFVSIVFVFAIARQTLAKRLSKTIRLESTRLGFPDVVFSTNMLGCLRWLSVEDLAQGIPQQTH